MQKINIESKNSLARLMATENLTIQHKKVATASFDVKQRILNLPIWNDMNNTMYEGLIGHEVGHALYTPYEEWKDFIIENPTLKDCANILEDARIEKKIKAKFPGMKKTFFNMYDELNYKDFFGIKDKDLSSYGLLDRINLYFKLGTRVELTFSDYEMDFVNRVAATETFDDVLKLSLELSDFTKNEETNTDFDDINCDEDPSNEDPSDDSETFEGSPNGPKDDSNDSDNGEDDAADGEDGEDDESEDDFDDSDNDEDDDSEGENDDSENNDLESKTQRRFDDKMSNLNDTYAKNPIYVDLPNVKVKNITLGYKAIGKKLNEFYSINTNYNAWVEDSSPARIAIDDEIISWKKDTVPVVNYMVKEFEMKQAASAHKRTSIGKTGVLDTNKMHAYSYEEDIFKRVASVRDGKSHALCIYVDWSGSMQDKLLSTAKQTMTLIMFAKKIGIPFRVYAFSNSRPSFNLIDNNKFYENNDNNNFHFNHLELGNLSLLEFFNDKMSAKEFSNMIANFYKLSLSNDWSGRSNVLTPTGFALSSTPLNECIVAAYEQVSDFKRNCGKEKMNVIFLTDGHSDGNSNYYDLEKTRSSYGYNGYGENQNYLIVRDPVTKHVIADSPHSDELTPGLLKGLSIRCGVTVVGFFLTDARAMNYKIDSAFKYEDAAIAKKAAKKNGYTSLTSYGYDKFFIVNDKSMAKEVEFAEVSRTDAGIVNKSKLKTAFKNFSKGRKLNKVLLNEFVQLIA